ncbi:MAG TPA: tetratricopeptide repeat protein, partial [Chromatiales bacterium]|nr:tetratricopeptide repeat protein [Chromatiales bacterium]
QLLGVINTQKGNINKAITLYKQALEVNPQFFALYNNLGSAYYSKGMFQEAADNFLHATTIKPSAESYYNLGNCMYELQRYEEATRNYQRALDIDPAHENAANNIKASRAKLAR